MSPSPHRAFLLVQTEVEPDLQVGSAGITISWEVERSCTGNGGGRKGREGVSKDRRAREKWAMVGAEEGK